MGQFHIPGGSIYSGKSGTILDSEFLRLRKEQIPQGSAWFIAAADPLLGSVALAGNRLFWYGVPIFITQRVRVVKAVIQITTLSALTAVRSALYRYDALNTAFTKVPGSSTYFAGDATGLISYSLSKPVELIPRQEPYFLFAGTDSNVLATAVISSTAQAINAKQLAKQPTDETPDIFGLVNLADATGARCPNVVYLSQEAAVVY